MGKAKNKKVQIFFDKINSITVELDEEGAEIIAKKEHSFWGKAEKSDYGEKMNKDLAMFFLILSLLSLLYLYLSPNDSVLIYLAFFFSLLFSFLSGFYAAKSKKLNLKKRIMNARYGK